MKGDYTNFTSMTFGDENQQQPQTNSEKLVSLNGLSYDLNGNEAKIIGEVNR